MTACTLGITIKAAEGRGGTGDSGSGGAKASCFCSMGYRGFSLSENDSVASPLPRA